MMEESSEAHMETDVSSTTEDILEPQVASSSHNNMEMVIVVEEIKNDEDFDDQSGTEETTNEDTSEISEKPTEESNKSISNISDKESEIPNSTPKPASKPGTPQKALIKESYPCKSTTPSPQKHQVKTIDSSGIGSPKIAKEGKIIKENVQINEILITPEKDVLPEESILSTPLENPVEETVIIPEKTNKEDINQTGLNQKDAVSKIIVLPVDVTVERDVDTTENDTQNESVTEEKEQNKSLSRELKSLINSAKESKIISECTQITSKIRKSRTPLDSASLEAEKLQGIRRNSNNSQKSNCSEKSEKALKRSMRSQNPEFVSKVKQFLHSVTSKVQKDSDEGTDDEVVETKINEKKEVELTPTKNMHNAKKRKVVEETVNTTQVSIKISFAFSEVLI